MKSPTTIASTFQLRLCQLNLQFISHSLTYNSPNSKPSLFCHVFFFCLVTLTGLSNYGNHGTAVLPLLFPPLPLFSVCSGFLTSCFLSYHLLSELSRHVKLLTVSVSCFLFLVCHIPITRSAQTFYLKPPQHGHTDIISTYHQYAGSIVSDTMVR